MRERNFALVAALVMGALQLQSSAAPADPRQEPAAEPVPSSITEKVEIRLAQFDVVVRDREGKTVSGLGKSDFAVLEEGEALKVVAVDEWGAPRAVPLEAAPAEGAAPFPVEPKAEEEPIPRVPPPAAAPPVEKRSVLLLFDILNGGSPLRIHQAKRAATEFVRKRLRPSDLAGVYQLDTALRPLSGFTADAAELERAIGRVTPLALSDLSDELAESVMAYRSRAGVGYMEQRLRRRAFLYTEMLDWQREAFYRSLQSLSDLFAGLPGRRILVLLSGGFPMTTPGDVQRESGGFTPAFRELIRKLAASGVTVYSMDIGDDLAIGDVSKTIDWRVAAGKLGMDENILQDIGLDRALSTGSAGQRRQVLGVLAGETGGRLLTHADLSRAFEVVDEESTHFYRISCEVPETRGAVRYRKITIRVGRPGLKVNARRGRYGDVVPAGPPPSAGVLDNLGRYRPISLRATTAVLPQGAQGGTFPVVVVAEALGPVALLPHERGGAEIELDFFAVARAGEDVIGRFSRSFSSRIKPGGVEPIQKAFRLEGRLNLPPGHYELQVTVRIAAPPQIGVWTGPLAVPAPSTSRDSRLEITSFVLAAQGDGGSPLLLRFEEPGDGGDPLSLLSGGRILPATEPSYEPGGGLLALFWLRGLPASGEADPKVQITPRILDEKGARRAAPARLLELRPDGPRGHRGVVAFDISALEEGVYRLEVEVADPVGSVRIAGRQVTFRVSGAAPGLADSGRP